MYIIDITNIAGEEVWYEGAGWYYTNEAFTFIGPFKTEYDAIESYAWHMNDLFDRIMAYDDQLNPTQAIITRH